MNKKMIKVFVITCSAFLEKAKWDWSLRGDLQSSGSGGCLSLSVSVYVCVCGGGVCDRNVTLEPEVQERTWGPRTHIHARTRTVQLDKASTSLIEWQEYRHLTWWLHVMTQRSPSYTHKAFCWGVSTIQPLQPVWKAVLLPSDHY